jgi:asparagine synthase (glutamine-hydrolysing)
MPDDNRYARALARLHGFKHHDIPVSPDAVGLLEEMAYVLDEPIADPAAINTYLICREAKTAGIKVLLSGMGADELFAGYRRHYATLLAQQYRRYPQWVRSTIKNLTGGLPVRIGPYGIRPVRWARRFLSFAGLPVETAYMRSYSYYAPERLKRLFQGDFDREVGELSNFHRERFNAVPSYDNINKMCYTDIQLFMTGLNLSYTDRASMANSVEVRVPYIDREIVSLAMSIPGSLKLKGRTSKYILKKAAEPFLPKWIIHRPKASFGMPIRSWISRELRGTVDEALSLENIKKRGIFDPQMVREIIERDRKGFEDNAYQIYQFLTLELWLRRFGL